MTIQPKNFDVARCPAPTTQELVHRGGAYVPPQLAQESYEFLGDEDISYDRYISPEFFRKELDHVWAKSWQWVCREEHIPQPGDNMVYEVGPFSFLIVRGQDNVVRAFYNACLHRATKLRPPESEGNNKDFRCPYHGWTFSTEGELKDMPCKCDFPHVWKDPAKFRLPQVKVALWGGFVFINMDDNAQPFEDYAATLIDHFKDWDMDKRYVAIHTQKELPCNWKTGMEAFMEAYHVTETHPQLMPGQSCANTQYDIYGDHVSRFYSAAANSCPNYETKLTEQEIVEQMMIGDRSVLDDSLKVGPGQTARSVMAAFLRRTMGEQYRTDLSKWSDSEMLDTIEYTLFPNMFLFPGISLPMVYRFRPLGMDPNKCLFDLLFLRPLPDHGEAPPPAMPHRVKEEESYATAPGFDAGMGHVYDQDTANLRMQQEGFHASKKRGQTLANYEEIRIRHFQRTLDKYIARGEAGM